MAESILTSINLAGGSFNVYYDTILSVKTVTGSSAVSSSNSCPSGWKCAVLISCFIYLNAWATLVTPIPIFNVNSSSIEYYGLFNIENNNNNNMTTTRCIKISSSSFNIISNTGGSTGATIIFAA